MSATTRWFQWQRRTGPPIQVGDRQLRPIASVLELRWPYGGFVLNRPVAIEVSHAGESQEFEIIDVQHWVRLALIAIYIVCALAILLDIAGIQRVQTR